MNEALDVYRHNDKVACIHGYLYEMPEELPDTFFLKGANCWVGPPGSAHGKYLSQMAKS